MLFFHILGYYLNCQTHNVDNDLPPDRSLFTYIILLISSCHFCRIPPGVRVCVGDDEDLSGGHGVSDANQTPQH